MRVGIVEIVQQRGLEPERIAGDLLVTAQLCHGGREMFHFIIGEAVKAHVNDFLVIFITHGDAPQ
ncbi:hypothetical protein EBB59_12935 [Lysobacter pythonis]|uniref:Uncharacterized protein n=1 Tax=Solilutibacter pythonis TaxID=2483112 RepID=A0A3M2HJC5_9GAMM|nr:hypothetical protein EBB59_12935 [Lysobacter pythonis]